MVKHDPDTRNGRAAIAVRERILAGQRVSGTELQEEFGPSSNVVSTVARELTEEGYRLVRERETPPNGVGGMLSYWRLAHDDEEAYDPDKPLRAPNGQSAKAKAKAKRAAASKPERVEVVRRAPAPKPAPSVTMPEMPPLGSTLTVRFLMMDDDGHVTVALANGVHVWTASIEGVAER